MGAAEEGEQMMMTAEVPTPEEQQSVNALLDKIKPLSPFLKYAIFRYFTTRGNKRDPHEIWVISSAPVHYVDRNSLIEITRQIAQPQNAEQQKVIRDALDEELTSTGFFLSIGTAPEFSVRM